MSRLIVGPFNRVEGDLDVQLETSGGRVTAAWVNSPLYRGFEQILLGKKPEDALVYAPRVCGVCSISQSIATAHALADAYGTTMPPNGVLAINLIQANENLIDHLTHFYLFFMPDFARSTYATRHWHAAVETRFRAVTGDAAPEFLQARVSFMHLMGLLAGKWPHSLAIQPGGCTRAVTARERLHLTNVIGTFRRFLEKRVFDSPLEEIATLNSNTTLQQWRAKHDATHSDFAQFLDIADDTNLQQLGHATDRFMSYGSYRSMDGTPYFRRGVWENNTRQILNTTAITEDVSHSWMAGDTLPPTHGQTLPDLGRTDAYSWCKAPRLNGKVVEVGALARQVIDGQPLIRELVSTSGGNVRNRVIARLLETARVTLAMTEWANALQPNKPFFTPSHSRIQGEGVGLTEAARGSLGHWIRISNGHIQNYQIISPTTWNFSPRDAQGTPGALEQALVGVPVANGDSNPVTVQHIVRSFDPCMVCTVH